MKSALPSFREALSACASPIKTAAVLVGLGLTGLQSANAAVIPYTNDFSGTGDNVAFPNEVQDAAWTVTGGSYAFNFSDTQTVASSASLPLTNVAATSFIMQTQFTVGSSPFTPNSNGVTLGMGLFGADAAFGGTSASTSYYLADWQIANSGTPGTLRIIALGDTSGFTRNDVVVDNNTLSSTLAVNLNTVYTLRLDGIYSGGSLVMTLGIYNTSGAQIGTSATATDTSPLTGTFFGYRNRMGLGGGALAANFDNFSVTAIPEPGTVTMFALGAGAVLYGLRRRKIA